MTLRKLALALCLIGVHGAHASDTAAPPSVEVKGIRNPTLKPYEYMVAGLDAFDQHHALAPNVATLRFKLRARQPAPPGAMEDLKLRLAGDTQSTDLPLDSAHTFELPRSEAALKDNADLLLNKPKGGYRWQPDIHSPGVPDGMRRMGDLRLECEVLVSVAKKELGLWRTAFVNTVLLSGDWCNNGKFEIPTTTTRKLLAATLVEGEQRTALALSEGGMGYTPPLRNKTVPDDALVELTFAD